MSARREVCCATTLCVHAAPIVSDMRRRCAKYAGRALSAWRAGHLLGLVLQRPFHSSLGLLPACL